ncbi:hypothetical protein RKLH11_295 [Rhodobacteraceae bacterium KLH11]|nr:hypothetical protein RKLH11_295 [Rhodobacteraceae bacterium KLH11]
MGLLGQPLGYYDYLTILALILLLAAVMALFLFIMGLPGRIAIKRNHPHAEAVKMMGWMGFLAIVPWVHAFIWAFHDGVTVDVRRGPEDERKAIRDEIKRLGGTVKPEYQDPLDTDETQKS